MLEHTLVPSQTGGFTGECPKVAVVWVTSCPLGWQLLDSKQLGARKGHLNERRPLRAV